MTVLILKLVLAPLLVVGSSLAGRRWGPSVTGMLVTLPIVAGPILFITYLEHGQRFVARAASASLLGLVSLALFAVVFARLARTRAWPATLLTGWLACLACDLVLSATGLPALAGLGLALAATGLAVRAGSRTPVPQPATQPAPTAPSTQPAAQPPAQPPAQPSAAPRPPWWDLPARAAVTAVLVLALTSAAAHLGPALTGVLAPFPIGTSVVAVFALAQGGAPTANATLTGVLRGLPGFAVFCFLVAALAEPMGGGPAFAVATVGTLAVPLLLRWRLAARAGTSAVAHLPAPGEAG